MEGRIKNFYESMPMDAHENAFEGRVFHFGEPEHQTDPPSWVMAKYSAFDISDPDRFMSLLAFPYLEASGIYATNRLADLEFPHPASLTEPLFNTARRPGRCMTS